MASLQILKSSLSPFPFSQSNSRRKSCWFYLPLNSELRGEKFLSFQSHRRPTCLVKRRLTISCSLQEGDNQNNGEEPPESLFMKELRRRGMTPTSLLEESNRTTYGDEDVKFREEDGGYSKRNVVSTDYGRNLSNQREQSMALNSEGLEGLIPRAKLLLSIGGTFFLGFGPLILLTVAFFSALYIYFGSAFVHDASTMPVTPPQYVDPYALLEDQRISETDTLIN